MFNHLYWYFKHIKIIIAIVHATVPVKDFKKYLNQYFKHVMAIALDLVKNILV